MSYILFFLDVSKIICLRFALVWLFAVDPTFSHAMIGRLCTIPTCNWFTFNKYETIENKHTCNLDNLGNLEIPARTCLGKKRTYWWVHYALILICSTCANFFCRRNIPNVFRIWVFVLQVWNIMKVMPKLLFLGKLSLLIKIAWK